MEKLLRSSSLVGSLVLKRVVLATPTTYYMRLKNYWPRALLCDKYLLQHDGELSTTYEEPTF